MYRLSIKHLRLLLPAVFVFSFLACNSAPKDRELKPADFNKKMQAAPGAQLVDVRTPEEYAEGHLANAMNIDWNGTDFAARAEALDKAKPVFVYCRSGGRSSAAAESLRAMGFKQVYDMQGGITKWQKAGLPVENADGIQLKNLSLTTYNNMLKSHPQVLVDIYAPWCGPCKRMAPFIAEIEREQAGNLKVLRINADDNEDLMNRIGVDALPTVFVYQGGKETWKTVGYVEKEEILKHVNVAQ